MRENRCPIFGAAWPCKGYEDRMQFTLPDKEILYQALIDRNPMFEGRAFVCVTTTGVFCRLTCPARNPKLENSVFFETVAACLEAGYRPCKRCRPLESAGRADPVVADLVEALQAQPGHRWTERDVVSMGYDPSTVRRAFKRHFGATFLEMARLSRVRSGANTIGLGGRVIDAQLDAGFESGSGFRAAFARILGKSPARFSGNEELKADWIETPIGPMIAVADRKALRILEFFERKALPGELKSLQDKTGCVIGIGRFAPFDQIRDELTAFFAGDNVSFRTPLAPIGGAFWNAVWEELRRIPAGATRSYSELARAIGRPSSVRAVARANGANPIAIVIPCHRVIGADGSLTGYGGGLWRKQWLIEHEHKLANAGTQAP